MFPNIPGSNNDEGKSEDNPFYLPSDEEIFDKSNTDLMANEEESKSRTQKRVWEKQTMSSRTGKLTNFKSLIGEEIALSMKQNHDQKDQGLFLP